ncbi:MAG TPA: glutamate formimidoyltransferase [Aggregatilineales bacterium]|nr:glutamate formimidoyltransferase [Aggregatilineales bacterium]
MQLVECIPNFSEGRRPEVIEAILAAITGASDVQLLDHSSDPDHNRTVITFIGASESVEASAFAAIKTAAGLIDLDVHRGEHPRMGATDVVPFVPIRDITMADCVAMAKRVGARAGSELHIPVYLYEAAATRPDRENLENIRRGEYEGLKEAIRTDPNRVPDFGPSELGKAGATVIGARAPLIAFNAYLTTPDVEIAKRIAKAIRMSSGGLRYVKALGLLVEGHAQVSMNLTNFEKTPIHRVVEMIRREAARYGAGIAFTELVGLTPEEALIDSARWYLQLDLFKSDQILERRLQAEPPRTAGLADFVNAVASSSPAPGGGAVAALVGTLAAALAEMVAGLTIGKKKYAAVEAEMIELADSARRLRVQLLDAVDRDTAAYAAVMDAYKIDKSNPTRDPAIQGALREAAKVPLQVMQLTLDALALLHRVAEHGNPNAATDAATGAHIALAAMEAAGLNVRVNASNLTDADHASKLRVEVDDLLTMGRKLSPDVVATAESRVGLR